MTISVVTGSSTGIGYATAQRLAKDGHHVIATMRDPSKSDLPDQGIEVRALDVTDFAAVDALFADIIATHGGVDVLVNNAGLGTGGIVEDTPLEQFRQTMETNFFGALACLKAVVPSMRERGSGAIVNVTSQAGVLAMPGMGPYCASKWALEAVSESLAVELWPFGVRVAIIEPGMIMTAIWGKVDMTPPSDPYRPVQARLGATVMREMAQGSTADVVADCIAEAIATESPKLRWLTGHGAERNVRVAAEIPFPERAALWNSPDQDEYFARMMPDE
jgi:NAD(P)-dependent dehydrogenase (short-subunit alcohol dehydrogenase family)